MISVIIPVYNGEAFIAQALESLQKQTLSEWEAVVVNDGSVDGTQEILEHFAAKDSRVRILSQPNGGVSAARNAAMAAARGTHYAFLDADDLWYPDHLAQLEELIRAYPQAGLFGIAYDILYPGGQLADTTSYFAGKADPLYLPDFLEAYARDKAAKCFALSSTCVRADCVRRVGGFRLGCRIGEDLALTLHIAACFPVVLCGHKTVRYRKAHSTATRTTSFDPDWYFFEQAKQLEKEEALPQERKESLRRIMDWFQIRRVRHYLVDGRRQDAKEAWRQIRYAPELGRDIALTGLLFFLPGSVVRKIFLSRWKRQA